MGMASGGARGRDGSGCNDGLFADMRAARAAWPGRRGAARRSAAGQRGRSGAGQRARSGADGACRVVRGRARLAKAGVETTVS